MTSYITIYTELNLFCSLLILVFLVHSFLGLGESITQRRFLSAMISLIVFFLSDTIWYAMDVGAIFQNQTYSMILKSVYFLSASCNGYFWMRYFETILKNPLMKSRKVLMVLALPLIAHLLLSIVNLKTGILFSLDDHFVYHRGVLFLLQYIIIYAYIITSCAHALFLAVQKNNYVDRDKYILIALFPVLPAIGGILQYFFPRVPINCVCSTLASTIIYLGGLSQQISLEPLTGLENKRQFMRMVEQYIQSKEKEEPLYLLMLDMNRFKGINDTYGHMEGDLAICTVADIIKRAANEMLRDSPTEIKKKITIARYGGDEFVIAMIAEEEDALFLKALVHDHLKEYNDVSGKPYKLSTSIGIALWKPEYESLKAFIEIADHELYKEKEISHRKEM